MCCIPSIIASQISAIQITLKQWINTDILFYEFQNMHDIIKHKKTFLNNSFVIYPQVNIAYILPIFNNLDLIIFFLCLFISKSTLDNIFSIICK